MSSEELILCPGMLIFSWILVPPLTCPDSTFDTQSQSTGNLLLGVRESSQESPGERAVPLFHFLGTFQVASRAVLRTLAYLSLLLSPRVHSLGLLDTNLLNVLQRAILPRDIELTFHFSLCSRRPPVKIFLLVQERARDQTQGGACGRSVSWRLLGQGPYFTS